MNIFLATLGDPIWQILTLILVAVAMAPALAHDRAHHRYLLQYIAWTLAPTYSNLLALVGNISLTLH